MSYVPFVSLLRFAPFVPAPFEMRQHSFIVTFVPLPVFVTFVSAHFEMRWHLIPNWGTFSRESGMDDPIWAEKGGDSLQL